jgi:hypothetical protein
MEPHLTPSRRTIQDKMAAMGTRIGAKSRFHRRQCLNLPSHLGIPLRCHLTDRRHDDTPQSSPAPYHGTAFATTQTPRYIDR